MIYHHLSALHEMSTKMFEYFSEMQDIRENHVEPSNDIVSVDEVEEASDFLNDVGLHEMVDGDIERNDDMDLEEILTPAQIVTLKKKIATFRSKTVKNRPNIQPVFNKNLDDNLLGKDSSSKYPPFFTIPYNATTLETALVLSGLSVIDQESQYLKSNLESTSYSARNMKSGEKSNIELTSFFEDKQILFVTSKKYCTSYDDLSKGDLNLLRSIAELQLLTLFDSHKIKYIRRKRIKKKKDGEGVFGVSLDTLIQRDEKLNVKNIKIPNFLTELINHLEENCLSEEGLLRIPGSSSRIKEARQQIDSYWPLGKFNIRSLAPHDSSSLLKTFLRNLPQPLLTYEWMDAFIQTMQLACLDDKIYAYTLLLLILPSVNRFSLQVLLSFLSKVGSNKLNKMSEDSVAMVAAPNLFLYSDSPGQISHEQSLQLACQHTEVVQFLLKNKDNLFMVPDDLILQVRKMNEKTKKFKFYSNISYPLMKPMHHVMLYIKVDIIEELIPIEITKLTTVNDVIQNCMQYLRNQNISIDDNSHCNMYELGGNIDEHRLDIDVCIKAILQVNPKAVFLLRTSSNA